MILELFLRVNIVNKPNSSLVRGKSDTNNGTFGYTMQNKMRE